MMKYNEKKAKTKMENKINYVDIKTPFECKAFEKIRGENLPDEYKKQILDQELIATLYKLFKDKTLDCLLETLLEIEDFKIVSELFKKHYHKQLKQPQIFILECAIGAKWKDKQDNVNTWFKFWEGQPYWNRIWIEIEFAYNLKRFKKAENNDVI